MNKNSDLPSDEAKALHYIEPSVTRAVTTAPVPLLNPKPLPVAWDAELVGERLIEAYRTIARMRISVGPRRYASAWPGYQSMTPGEITELMNEAQKSGTLRQLYADLNRTKILPSKEAIERAEEALAWPRKYLHTRDDLAMLVTGWAAGMFRKDETPGPAREGLRIIARRLDRDRVPVR